MRLIDAETVADYLRDTQHIAVNERVGVRELPGGVSNIVLLVSRHDADQPDFVVKQARQQLRVADDWFCDVERIWREVDVLRVCHSLLLKQNETSIQVPRVLFTDADNYLFAMTAAPAHQTWKQLLLEGHTDATIAVSCGTLLGTLHAETWRDVRLAEQFGDSRFFEDLRVDPYYRQAARVHGDLSAEITELIESVQANPLALVHGDFSPKNLLVSRDGLMLVDFEVGHFGDPAFDLGFFLSHLVLKAVRADAQFVSYLRLTNSFWDSYRQHLQAKIGSAELTELQRRAVANCACCVLARIDGKSKVEYLDEPQRRRARGLARDMLLTPSATWDEVLQRVFDELELSVRARRSGG